MSKEFAAMEEAALKAYEKDMKRLKAETGKVTLCIRKFVLFLHYSIAISTKLFAC